MLERQGDDRYDAVCESCPARETVHTSVREIAVLRLARIDWRIRQDGRAYCPSCAATSAR